MAVQSDAEIAAILRSVRRIALLGASAKPARPAFGVMRFLLSRGYEVVPVNPGLAGGMLLDQPVVATLAEAGPVDMVDVFRNAEFLPEIVEDILAAPAPHPVLWTQLGVVDDAALARAEDAGLTVVADRCPAIEIPRLGL